MKAEYLQSTKFLLLVLILAMLNNLEHSAWVYFHISHQPLPYHWLNVSQSVLVVLIIDISIIAFVVHGRKKEAGVYAILLLFLNLLYYDGLNLLNPEANERIAKLIFSAMFTYSIYVFTDMWLFKLEKSKTDKEVTEVIAELHNKESQSNNIIEALKAELQKLKAIESAFDSTIKQNEQLSLELNKYKNRFSCTECGFEAQSEAALKGHQKKHSTKKA